MRDSALDGILSGERNKLPFCRLHTIAPEKSGGALYDEKYR